MRRGAGQSLKGRNKWVRPADDASTAPNPSTFTRPAPTAPATKPLQRVGKYALARDPNVPQTSKSIPLPPKPAPAANKSPVLNKNRFKYERPKDETAGADDAKHLPAAPIQPPLAAIKSKSNISSSSQAVRASVVQAPLATSSQPSKPVSRLGAAVLPRSTPKPGPKNQSTLSSNSKPEKKKYGRSGALRWTKYVRESLGGKMPSNEDGTRELASTRNPPSSGAIAPATTGARRSRRLQLPSRASQQQQSRSVPQQAQRTIKLLRLGGQVYSVSQRGKARSLTLQTGTEATPQLLSDRKLVAKQSSSQIKTTGAGTPRTLAPSVSTRSRSLQKLIAPKSSLQVKPRGPQQQRRQEKQQKPMSRLKGGRLVYCPVYCHTGKCPRRSRGCPYRHDPTKRAVCSLWLRNRCMLGSACPLQHQRRPELMPACVHFLQVGKKEFLSAVQ